MSTVGQVLFTFFEDHLKAQKGLRPGSIKSYRDTMKLYLAYVALACHKPITRLALTDLSSQRVLDFLRMLEEQRHNQAQRAPPFRAAHLLSLPGCTTFGDVARG